MAESCQSVTKSFCRNKREVVVSDKWIFEWIEPFIFFIAFNFRVPVLFVVRYEYVSKFSCKTHSMTNSSVHPHNSKLFSVKIFFPRILIIQLTLSQFRWARSISQVRLHSHDDSSLVNLIQYFLHFTAVLIKKGYLPVPPRKSLCWRVQSNAKKSCHNNCLHFVSLAYIF